MTLAPWRSWIATVHARWTAIERDWRSVAVGAVLAALVGAFDVHIPW